MDAGPPVGGGGCVSFALDLGKVRWHQTTEGPQGRHHLPVVGRRWVELVPHNLMRHKLDPMGDTPL